MANETRIEYRVIPTTRYIITRYSSESGPHGESGGCEGRGEYSNADVAYDVAYALARAEHERMGWPIEDERIKYPEHPATVVSARSN